MANHGMTMSAYYTKGPSQYSTILTWDDDKDLLLILAFPLLAFLTWLGFLASRWLAAAPGEGTEEQETREEKDLLGRNRFHK